MILLVLSLPSTVFWIASMVSVVRSPKGDWDSAGRKVIAFLVVLGLGANVGIFVPVGALVWWFDWRTKEKWGHYPGRARWVERTVLPAPAPAALSVPVGGLGALPPPPPASWGPPFPPRDLGGPAIGRQRAVAALAYLGIPFCLAILPAVVYLDAKRGSFVRAHARQALAIQLGALLLYLASYLYEAVNPDWWTVSAGVLLVAALLEIPLIIQAARGRAPLIVWRPEPDGWTQTWP